MLESIATADRTYRIVEREIELPTTAVTVKSVILKVVVNVDKGEVISSAVTVNGDANHAEIESFTQTALEDVMRNNGVETYA